MDKSHNIEYKSHCCLAYALVHSEVEHLDLPVGVAQVDVEVGQVLAVPKDEPLGVLRRLRQDAIEEQVYVLPQQLAIHHGEVLGVVQVADMCRGVRVHHVHAVRRVVPAAHTAGLPGVNVLNVCWRCAGAGLGGHMHAIAAVKVPLIDKEEVVQGRRDVVVIAARRTTCAVISARSKRSLQYVPDKPYCAINHTR